MPSPSASDTVGQIQKGYRAVPISQADGEAALRLCAMVREAPDPVAGVFVLLRESIEASIYLGALVDAGGQVHQWLELWVQNINNLDAALEAYRETFSNHTLDERWTKRAGFLARLDRAGKIEMGFEAAHPLPIYFDLALSGPVNPAAAATSAPWELCLDDRLLEKHGLPRYSTSISRYLCVRGQAGPPFLPATAGAPENDSTRDIKQALGAVVPLNADGGLMMLRKFTPLSYEAYVDLLGGQPWKGIEEGAKVFKLSGVYRTLQNAEAVEQGGAHLFLGKRGGAGRLIETFHLKLDLLLQAFRAVRDFVREEQLPFLNLSADSFRVALAETGSNLPFLWTGKVALSALGSAFALPVETGDARYFITDAGTSIYRTATPSAPVSAVGAVRIRKVLSQNNNSVVLEGTISTQERIAISQTDLLWIRLTLSSGRVDFHANLTEGLAQGEQRFRTLPQVLPENLGLAIRSAEGVSFPNVPFETLPLRSSPCDLYSLAVLGVRTLLVNEENTLAVALDEILSLAQAVETTAGEGVDFGARVRAIATADSRWQGSLGPHRLLKSLPFAPGEALAYLPAELWWDAVAALIRCFPGATRDAFCADLGDAPPLALDSAFEPAIVALERICLRSRSLLFVDWKYNSEVNAVITAALRRHMAEAGR